MRVGVRERVGARFRVRARVGVRVRSGSACRAWPPRRPRAACASGSMWGIRRRRPGRLALRRPLSAQGRALGCPELRPASANQPLGPRRPATSGVFTPMCIWLVHHLVFHVGVGGGPAGHGVRVGGRGRYRRHEGASTCRSSKYVVVSKLVGRHRRHGAVSDRQIDR